MMLFQIAFILLCLAQMLHYSTHWLALTRSMRDDRDQKAMTSHLDWSRAADLRASKKRGLLSSFWRG